MYKNKILLYIAFKPKKTPICKMNHQQKKFNEYNTIKNSIIAFNAHNKQPTAMDIARSLNYEKKLVNYHLYAMSNNGLVYAKRPARHVAPRYTWYEFLINRRMNYPVTRSTRHQKRDHKKFPTRNNLEDEQEEEYEPDNAEEQEQEQENNERESISSYES